MDRKRAYRIIQSWTDNIIPTQYKTAVARWLVSDTDKDVKDEVLNQLWNETNDEPDSDLYQSLQIFQTQRHRYTTKFRRRLLIGRMMRYAAILLLPLLTGIAVWLFSSKYYYQASEMMECYVPNGTMKTILLPDGTSVVINSGSTLLYPKIFKGDKRCIYLSGEAHFAVAKDPDHPFIVRVGRLNVQVLGTHFNIEAYTDEETVKTTLEEGSVKLFESGKTSAYCILKPNEQALYDRKTGKMIKCRVEADNFSSWTEGNLNFESRPLNEIISALEHRFDVHFMIDHTLNLKKEYTMNFKSYETIDDILKVLTQLSGNVSFKKEGQIIKLYQSRKEGTK